MYVGYVCLMVRSDFNTCILFFNNTTASVVPLQFNSVGKENICMRYNHATSLRECGVKSDVGVCDDAKYRISECASNQKRLPNN